MNSKANNTILKNKGGRHCQSPFALERYLYDKKIGCMFTGYKKIL
jgi:hypothetical protein